MASKSEVITAQNELTSFIKKAITKHNLSRVQIRYLLTDKLNDMSKTDVYWPGEETHKCTCKGITDTYKVVHCSVCKGQDKLV